MSGAAAWLRAALGAPRFWRRGRDAHYVRLAMLRELRPRFTPGSVRLPFGRLDYADAASLEAQYHDIFVRQGYAFETREPAPVILDCGGNIGLAAVWFKLHHPGARITVFEPGEALCRILRGNLERLGFTDVAVEQAAVWHEDTTLTLCNDAADGGFVDAVAPGEGCRVRAVRLAERITGPVDLLKLDVEGSEYAVIEDLAASGALGRVRALAGELHAAPGDAGRVAALLARLAEAGFRLTLSHARTAPALFGRTEPTPFPALADGKYLAHVYAWRELGP